MEQVIYLSTSPRNLGYCLCYALPHDTKEILLPLVFSNFLSSKEWLWKYA